MDIRATQAERLYFGAKPATHPAEKPSDGATVFGDAATSFVETMRQAEQTAQAAMVGKADPHALVQALAQTELAIETAVTLRDKVVEAYQEILRMPV